MEVKFKKGTTAQIESMSVSNGSILFDTEEQKIYLDENDERIEMANNTTDEHIKECVADDLNGFIWFESTTGTNESINTFTRLDSYKRMKIFYCDKNNNTLESKEIEIKDGAYFNLFSTFPYLNEETYIYGSRYLIDGTSLTYIDGSGILAVFTPGAYPALSQDNQLYILKVIVYK